ncbi:MAG: sigma-70 family RNA polymerase sigma factor [Oscillospiraceae bacterium]|nr:sigma-70 family RNA polymerase sigma factor [Oscillospiraceae bacterium]
MDHKEIALLVEKAKENDKSAMGKLYNETHKKAYFVALKMTKNEDDAMDILQDSFVKAFKKIDTLENPEQFQSWLNQIVANKCRDYLKKKKEIFFSETEDEDGNSIEDTFEEENISLIPDKSLDTAETKRLVMNIIEGLSEDQKLCVLMYYYENMSVGDIAEALECSTGTVKSRLNYARQKIKTEVENLEKTQGIKLYGIAPVPFVVWVLMRMSESTVVPRDIAPLVIESAVGTAGAAGAATAAGGTAGAAAGGAAGATGATAITGKTIALISAGVIAVGGIGVAVAVTNSEPEIDLSAYTYEYSEEIDGMIITDYNGEEIELIIPAEIDGKPVKEIGEEAFEKCKSIQTVVIPKNIETIGNGAFQYCTNLKEITIPDSVSSIGNRAFKYCKNLEGVTIPDRVTYLGSYTFYSCEKLEKISLSDNITQIEKSTFEHCRNLKEIIIPDGVKKIDELAFQECESLTKINIPYGVTSIGSMAFEYCTNLKEVVMPDGVKGIGSAAFNDCENLTEITLPNSIEGIGVWAFSDCPNIVVTYKGKTYTYAEIDDLYHDINYQ